MLSGVFTTHSFPGNIMCGVRHYRAGSCALRQVNFLILHCSINEFVTGYKILIFVLIVRWCITVHAHLHMYVCKCVGIHVCIYISVCMYVFKNVWMNEWMNECIFIYVFMHACMYVCMYVFYTVTTILFLFPIYRYPY